MSNNLCNVYKFSNTKTVKLLDTYSVQIQLSEDDLKVIGQFIKDYQWFDSANRIFELPQCVSVTLPELQLKTDEYKYGNNSKLMVYPDLDQPGDLKLEFMETLGGLNPYTNKPVPLIQLFVNLFLSKLFDASAFAYKLHDYIPSLTIFVYSNNFQVPVYKYEFKELKLTNNTKYTLDYSNADICKWTLEFAYRSYTQWSLLDKIGNTFDTKVTQTSTNTGLKTSNTVSAEPPSTPNVNAISSNTATTGNTEPTNIAQVDTPINNELGEIRTNPTESVAQGMAAPESIKTELQGDMSAPSEGVNTLHSDDNTRSKEQLIKDSNEKANKLKESINPLDGIGELGEDTTAASLLVETDQPTLNPDQDKIDELAYQMMRGNLGNGQPRKDSAAALGFTDSEIKQAQSIVNENNWDGLKERHDNRVATPAINDINGGAYADITPPQRSEQITSELKGNLTAPDISKPTTTLNDVKTSGGVRSDAELKADSDKKSQALKVNPLDDIGSFDTELPDLDETKPEKQTPLTTLPYKSEAEYNKAKSDYEKGREDAWSAGYSAGLQSYMDKHPVKSAHEEQLWYDKHSAEWDKAGKIEGDKKRTEYETLNSQTKQKLAQYEAATR